MDIEIKAIDQAAVRALLDSDDAGRAPTVRIDEEGGSPLRCCLGKAEPGERIALLSYAPLRRWAAGAGVDPGAYDEVGPIFVHAGPCPGSTGRDGRTRTALRACCAPTRPTGTSWAAAAWARGPIPRSR